MVHNELPFKSKTAASTNAEIQCGVRVLFLLWNFDRSAIELCFCVCACVWVGIDMICFLRFDRIAVFHRSMWYRWAFHLMMVSSVVERCDLICYQMELRHCVWPDATDNRRWGIAMTGTISTHGFPWRIIVKPTSNYVDAFHSYAFIKWKRLCES